MGVPTSEVGYTSVTTGRGDHEVHKRHVVGRGKKFFQSMCCKNKNVITLMNSIQMLWFYHLLHLE
jgi:hypothetical protein